MSKSRNAGEVNGMKYPTVIQGRCSLCKREDSVCIKLKVGNPIIGFGMICDSCFDFMLKVVRAWPDRVEVRP